MASPGRPRWICWPNRTIKLVIGAFSPEQLRGADEAFITSTMSGIVPVTRIDHRPVGDGEPAR